MPVVIKQKAKAPAPSESEAVAHSGAPPPTTETTTKPTAAPDLGYKNPDATGKSFMKSGSAAKAEMDHDQQTKQQNNSEVFRFWMKPGESKHVTFIDGGLDAEGFLNAPGLWEHREQVNGGWKDIPCLEQMQDGSSCPLCESGKNKAFIAFVTVVDHDGYVNKKNEHIKNVVRLFGMKSISFNQLSTMAAKRGGLAGWKVEVGRSSKNTARIGDMFDFETQTDPALLVKMYGEDTEAVDYGPYFEGRTISRKELNALGFGTTPIGGEDGVDTTDLEQEL